MLRLNYDKRDLGPAFACAVTVMTVASLLLALLFGNAEGWRFWLMQALYTLLIGASAFIYSAVAHTNPIAAMRLNVKPKWAHMCWGFAAIACLIFGMMPLNELLMDAIEAIGLKRPSVELPNDLAGLLVVATLLPAFCEEAVFRGVIAPSAAGMRSKWGALALCGGLFALFHANPAQTVHQFVLGGFLALLALRSGSLWTAIAAHLFNNALVVALSFVPALGSDEFWSVTSNTLPALCIMAAGLIGFTLSVWGYIRTTRSNWSAKDDSTPQQRSTSVAALCISAAVCAALWISALFV